MLIFTVIFIACAVVAAVCRKKPEQKQTAVLSCERIDALLYNIEVYDGTPKGQKRLEDIK